MSLSVTKYYGVKTYGGMEVQLYTSANLTPEKSSRHPLDRRLGGSRAGPYAVAKRKIPAPVVQPVA
jgi:hypothetical protein